MTVLHSTYRCKTKWAPLLLLGVPAFLSPYNLRPENGGDAKPYKPGETSLFGSPVDSVEIETFSNACISIHDAL